MPLLTDQQLAEITELAGLMYTPKQICIMLELEPHMLTSFGIDGSLCYNAYWKGYYQAEMEFRGEVKRLSNLGSSPAQSLFAKFIEQHKLDMLNK